MSRLLGIVLVLLAFLVPVEARLASTSETTTDTRSHNP